MVKYINTYISFLRLPNILIILGTQVIVYFGLIRPALKRNDILSALNNFDFITMFLITSIITISGYIINDILDIGSDKVNRKSKKNIGKSISLKTSKLIYLVLFLLGFVLSFIYALEHHVMHLLFIYPVAFALLAFYSYKLKSTPLAGNVLVSLFSAAVVAILILFDHSALQTLKVINQLAYSSVLLILNAFILFAFLCSFFREVVKDIEDYDGDHSFGLNTTAVFFGKRRTRSISLGLGIIMLVALATWIFQPINSMHVLFRVYGILLMVYNLIILIGLSKADKKEDFNRISKAIKIFMGLGLLYLLLYSIYF